MRRVIIESPYSGHIIRNTLYARAAVAHALSLGDAPFASHLLYTQNGILDDAKENDRWLGIAAGLIWGRVADATIVYIDLGISEGMKTGVRDAQYYSRPVELRSILRDETFYVGWTEPLDECVARAASIFGVGDAARYYHEQEAIVARFQAIASAMDHINEALTTIRQDARGHPQPSPVGPPGVLGPPGIQPPCGYSAFED